MGSTNPIRFSAIKNLGRKLTLRKSKTKTSNPRAATPVALWRRPFFMLALISLCLTAAMAYYFWCDLYALFIGGLTSWDDARGLGLFIGGIIAPFVTFLGLDLASQRVRGQDRQTNELQKQNLAHDEEKPITRLCRALELIEQDAETKRIVGLALFRQPSLANERSTLEAAVSALKSFTKKKSDQPHGLRELSSLSGKEIGNSRWGRLEASEALKSFLYLADLRTQIGGLSPSALASAYFQQISVEGIKFKCHAVLFRCNFKKAEFTRVEFSDVRFSGCNFSESRFSACSFRSLAFARCNLSEADFSSASFDIVIFNNCNVSGTTFGSYPDIELSELLKRCFYFGNNPPNVPSGTLLPIPHIEDENIPVGHRKMVEKEIKGIGDGRLVAEYHRNGQIIGMRFTEVQD